MAKTVSEQLRHVIETCGKTRYRIAQDTGIDEATLSRIVNDAAYEPKAGTIDTLAKYLGLELRKKK
jgi:transcriptional regulator with XRE-family HTH domain